jgi:2-polyprenyl-3-methyl-5-hydroxy-6-metoxy-1,4-benzoquinol methylase
MFSGASIMAHVMTIADLIDEVKVQQGKSDLRILDYGCGKGIQYAKHGIHKLHWKVSLPFRYDIGVPNFRTKPPAHSFDGVVCTDVMEHIEEEDLETIFTQIFNSLDPNVITFAFFSICCRFAKKTFPDGRNVHRTVQPPEWWHDRMARYKDPKMRVIVHYT